MSVNSVFFPTTFVLARICWAATQKAGESAAGSGARMEQTGHARGHTDNEGQKAVE